MRKIPLTYFITFTCYGTWLHGDDRGSVDEDHRKFDTPFVEANTARYESMRKKMKESPLFLIEEQRALVAAVIAEVCVFRNWTLHECNVRSNHVHVVVSSDADPDKIMKDFKAYATKRLRESEEVEQSRTVWTEGGSTRYLWTETSLSAAMEYVRNHNYRARGVSQALCVCLAYATGSVVESNL